MTIETYPDVLQILKEHKILLGDSLISRLVRKINGLKYWLKGEATFFSFFFNFFPTRFRPERFRSSVLALSNKVISDRIFQGKPANPLKLLNFFLDYNLKPEEKNWTLPLFLALREIKDIIVYDQYAAKDFIKDGDIVIDAGANIGVFSLWAAFLNPAGQIYAFEPSQENFSLLEKNILNNNLKNVFCQRLALGNQEGEAELLKASFSLDGLGSSCSLKNSHFADDKEYFYNSFETVPIISIDQFVLLHQLPRLDFIKIDTEGYEKQIIKGAYQTIKKFKPVIACSAYHFKNDKEDIPHLIKEIEPSYHYKLINRGELDLIFYPNKNN